jgi:hypothetical protein
VNGSKAKEPSGVWIGQTDRIGEDLLATGLLKSISLRMEGLVMGGDSSVADEHSDLEDRQLGGLLLFLSLVVESQTALRYFARGRV